MATTVDAKAIAGALYDALFAAALAQLKAAAPKLSGPLGSDPIGRIDAALPADALPQVRNFLRSLAREGLLDQVDAITQAFESISRPSTQPLDGEITSAVELEPGQRERILADMRQRYGNDLELRYSVDPSLIGGLIIRVGDQVLDNSLRTRLGAVQRNMLTS